MDWGTEYADDTMIRGRCRYRIRKRTSLRRWKRRVSMKKTNSWKFFLFQTQQQQVETQNTKGVNTYNWQCWTKKHKSEERLKHETQGMGDTYSWKCFVKTGVPCWLNFKLADNLHLKVTWHDFKSLPPLVCKESSAHSNKFLGSEHKPDHLSNDSESKPTDRSVPMTFNPPN